jgi:hypothetical protein
MGTVLDARQELDIRRAAALMVRQYGGAAAARAARRSCVLLCAGYTGAANIWSGIATTIRQLHQKDTNSARQEPALSLASRETQVIRSPYPSGRVRPTPPSSAGRRVAVGRLIPSLSPSVGAP